MDIASKLKFMLWCLVTGLWALFMYQYIEGDLYRKGLGAFKSGHQAVDVSTNVVSASAPEFSTAAAMSVSGGTPSSSSVTGAAEGADAAVPAVLRENYASSGAVRRTPLLEVPKAKIKGKNPFAEIAVSTYSAYDFNTPISTKAYTSSGQAVYVPEAKQPEKYAEKYKEKYPEKEKLVETYSVPRDARQNRIEPLKKDISPLDYPDTPAGFQQKVTRHFVLYEEGEVSSSLETFSERIHGNIMLDLVDFSPWTREKKVFIFYSHSQSSYQKLSGRPAWSGGAASLNERRIYLYHSKDAYGLLAHELTHMYFDSFFPPSHPSPLWLSEGMAIFVQSERAEATPNWLTSNLKRIHKGAGYRISDLINIDDLDGADEDNIRLWYAQSYSFTKYLMNVKGNRTFYNFCNNIRNGFSVEQALSIAYSQNLKTLEYNWRYSLAAYDKANQR